MEGTDSEKLANSAELAAWETAMIELFVRAASSIGLPRSMGEIYGILYCSSEPLSFERLSEKLGISRGSVSQGLKTLRQLGAVKTSYVPGSRKDYYVAELSMKRLVGGFLHDQVNPHLESGQERLDHISRMIDQTDSENQYALSQLSRLRTWQSRIRRLMPIVLSILGGSSVFDSEKESGGGSPVI